MQPNAQVQLQPNQTKASEASHPKIGCLLQRLLASALRNSNKLARHQSWQYLLYFGNERQQIHDVVAASVQSDDRDSGRSQILLILNPTVRCQEHGKPIAASAPEQLAIVHTGPPSFLNSCDIVAGERTAQRPWQALVEEDPHRCAARLVGGVRNQCPSGKFQCRDRLLPSDGRKVI